MSALSQVRIESEAEHFKNNPATLLKVHQLRHHKIAKNLDLHNYQTWLYGMIERFLKLKNAYLKQSLRIKENWGFLYFKCLLLNTADFIIAQKRRGEPLNRAEVVSLLTLLKQNQSVKHYLKGAKLSLLIDADDALSDAELFYLTRDENEVLDDNEQAPLLLGSYHESLLEDLLSSMRFELKNHQQRQATNRLRKVTALSCILLVPLFGFLLQLP